MPTNPQSLLSSRRKPIAACVALLFALASPLAKAVTFVTNCNDSGVGSLREAVGAAEEGGSVDRFFRPHHTWHFSASAGSGSR